MSIDSSLLATTSRYQQLNTPKATALRGLMFDAKPPLPEDFFLRPKPKSRAHTQFFPRGRKKPLGAYIDFGFPKIPVAPQSRASGSATRGSAIYSVRSSAVTPHPDVIALQAQLY